MRDLTNILRRVDSGKDRVAEDLLSLVYDELRRIAAAKMAGESASHTLQPTALVHEAWLRLRNSDQEAWKNRAHFFSACAEAMRRILVEHARRKKSLKRGGGAAVVALEESALVLAAPPDELLAVHEALHTLEKEDSSAAELVKLRYFVGMTMEETADSLGLSKRTAENLWTYARAWLHREITSLSQE